MNLEIVETVLFLFLVALVLVPIGIVVFMVADRWKTNRVIHSAPPGVTIPPEVLKEMVAPMMRPSVLINLSKRPGGSYLGGLPPMHEGFEWPVYQNRPLNFLGCIDLAELDGTLDWLPRAGWLLFFYDLKEMPWSPDHAKGPGAWRVLYVAAPPPEPTEAESPKGLKPIKKHQVSFRTRMLPPTWYEKVIDDLKLSHESSDDLIEWRSELEGDANHQIGGWSNPMQDAEMPWYCQQYFLGVPVEGAKTTSEEVKAGAADWELLLQLGSEDDLGFMWGDAGNIYFWVQKEAARRGDFSMVYLFLQCS
jgi:uncharacterized protein YwqG